ncbi:MAG TPA: hypothetical protein P5275_22430, partial [Saprospiraceae bacterium]|nr:hypothetical protein [Saprospiraceae bacterium]
SLHSFIRTGYYAVYQDPDTTTKDMNHSNGHLCAHYGKSITRCQTRLNGRAGRPRRLKGRTDAMVSTRAESLRLRSA